MKKILIAIGVIAVIIIVIITIGGFNKSKGTLQTGGIPTTQTISGQEEISKETGGASGKALMECNVGLEWTEGEIKYKITGVERYTVGGKTMDFCCEEWNEEYQKSKHCWGIEDKDYSITWMTDLETKKLFKAMEIWKQDGKMCSKVFGLDGNVETEMCK